MSTALQADPEVRPDIAQTPSAPIVTDGKFLRITPPPRATARAAPAGHAEAQSAEAVGGQRFLIKGVTYGTFAPDADGYQFPPRARIAEDFRLMSTLGINTVRTYTPPRRDLLDEAAQHGLRVMVGLPWSQHVAFLDDSRLKRSIRRELARQVVELCDHPAVLIFALGNEIPPGVVRWHGRVRVERFLRSLYEEAKDTAAGSLFTYVNFPPTEFLDLSFFDVCAFNVYLHREPELRAYLARLQHIASQKPLLLSEAGGDSIREGEAGQAAIMSMHVRAAFEEGACGAIAFAWTDEWWRGGHAVTDWNFGLVDRDRQMKPAAAAVSAAFADAPFSRERQRTWPRVSVVVCAYDAAETLENNLRSLEQLTYPDYEIILVNDGSKDRTSEIGRSHPRVRVIDIPNGGLSAARNVGLAEATGDIVAYTDADTRVDRDWLTFLVQPFLTSDVVGSGGPNVVPADDPPMAQCIARAPGGPTHVLLDDRIAEHVPGCNMAFRRDALLAIDGFNPIYLRAGDDVDVCWRLQARGWKIGFGSAALVWHHHRSSVKAYWRQQVGYGEGETWLMAHHPDKFLDGRMLWRGRIYSPLPFVRSLWGTQINAGVWGTAAFPSVYRTDVHPFAFLPHSIRWQVISFLLTVAGALVAASDHKWAAAMLLGGGMVGIAATIAKNIAYAMRSEVDSLRDAGPRVTFRKLFTRLWYRTTVAYLHFIQPLARIRGRIRGVLSPPEVALPRAERQRSRGPRPSLGEAWRALLLISGSVTEDRFWSDTWTSAERVLASLTDWLRQSRAVRTIEIDEGWSDDRDVSVFVGRWAWLDVRALVEDHGGGRSLLRVSTHLRPTAFGVVTALGLGGALFAGVVFGVALRWPPAGVIAAVLTLLLAAVAVWRTAQTAAIVGRGLDKVTAGSGFVAMRSGPARPPLVAPSLLRMYGLRSAIIFVIMIMSLGVSTFMLREAATGPVVGGRKGYAGDFGPAVEAWLDTPNGIVAAPNGDVYFADSNNDVIRRIDPKTNVITTIVGNHDLGSGFSGDNGPALEAQLDTPDGVTIAPDGDLIVADSHNDRIRRVDKPTWVITTIAGSGENGYDGDEKPATQAALNTPSAVAAAPNGDVYIADTLNYRVRMVEAKTGFIHTVAGDGTPGDVDDVGDGGPAISAHLNMPSDVAIAPNGDIYIADMHHNRVRKVDAKTHIITTVAGNGRWGTGGDEGPATRAMLSGPAGVAVMPEPGGNVTIFIADFYNGHVRAVGPDGIIRDLSEEGRQAFGAPSRVAYATTGPRRGWLYVADPSNDRIVPLIVSNIAPNLVPPRRLGPAKKVGE
ncbi:MAG TPA: glycosyltransferase [Vicinamibacterales bacterium]|nr:glycosyltransferase [Vicinamibacterales bacterium]